MKTTEAGSPLKTGANISKHYSRAHQAWRCYCRFSEQRREQNRSVKPAKPRGGQDLDERQPARRVEDEAIRRNRVMKTEK